MEICTALVKNTYWSVQCVRESAKQGQCINIDLEAVVTGRLIAGELIVTNVSPSLFKCQ